MTHLLYVQIFGHVLKTPKILENFGLILDTFGVILDLTV